MSEPAERSVELIELEMAYEPYSTQTSCLDPHIHDGAIRECRRRKNHQPPHASGHTANGSYMEWGETE